ncbi:sulfite oxidase [soil metagenome]
MAGSVVPPEKDPANFILHSEHPLTLETKRGALGGSGIIPCELLFVRNNLPIPEPSFVEDRDGWKLTVEGVGNPGTITVGELKALGMESIATVLQCSGNGRTFFQHEPSGSQWGVGAAACVVWSGVPVRRVVEALGGVVTSARYVTGTGGEVLPEGIDPREVVVERSIPLEKGMEDALLAWEVNGEPLPLIHGGPLRLIVPGYYGINQIKYIKRLAFTREESDARIMRTTYRLNPIGEEADSSQPTTWEMGVKSWINHPSGESTVQAGEVLIDGVAFGGTRAVGRVEVSTDGGETWQDAPLVGPDLGKYAWRRFALPVTLTPGTHTLASRATDTAGSVQPAEPVQNENGYANTGWRAHAVTISVS